MPLANDQLRWQAYHDKNIKTRCVPWYVHVLSVDAVMVL